MPEEKYYVTRMAKRKSEYPLFIVYSTRHRKQIEPFVNQKKKERYSINTTELPEAIVGRLEIILDKI